jgi:hypothetical protein
MLRENRNPTVAAVVDFILRGSASETFDELMGFD